MATGSVKKPISSIEYYTLVNGESVGTGNVTLYSGRKLSDYKLLLAMWRVNNTTRATAVFRPADIQAGNIELFYVDSANVQRWADLNYQSDTVVRLLCSSNAGGSMFLLGYKIE